MEPSDTLDLKQTKPRLYVYSLGLVFQRHVRKIIKAAGYELRFGIPGPKDAVVVWGRKRVSARGIWIAKWRKVPVFTIEDAFLRSVKTGRQGEEPVGIVLDDKGIYFDCNKPNRLHDLIEKSAGLKGVDLDHATSDYDLLKCHKLTKYNAVQSVIGQNTLPDSFVLVIDQTQNDASIILGGADGTTFSKMLRDAMSENPGKTILVKSHPEVMAGKRLGHFKGNDLPEDVQMFTGPLAPSLLFERATSVYCVTSQLGMEAIFAGHTPKTYGRPFYSGWGLTDDRHENAAVKGKRNPIQLFWAAYLQYPFWYNPVTDGRASFSEIVHDLHAKQHTWKMRQRRVVALGMRLWKRSFLTPFLTGDGGAPIYMGVANNPVKRAKDTGGQVAVWSSKETDNLARSCVASDVPLLRVEDGFIRSSGLGAQLVAPVSLVFDPDGIYYDSVRPSQLEHQISASRLLNGVDMQRAKNLRQRIVRAGLSKYNLTGDAVKFEAQKGQDVILISGQVEDDASIIKGTDAVSTNRDLIRATRAAFPDAYLIYKDHPDVTAGLRKGTVSENDFSGVDLVAHNAPIQTLLAAVDRVCTMTSLTGFEALLRGVPVTCFGVPFYAGWGLTDDKGAVPKRRKTKVPLDALVHAALIDYPYYWDPMTGKPCAPERILDRFEKGQFGASKPGIRWLAKAQGAVAGYSWMWR